MDWVGLYFYLANTRSTPLKGGPVGRPAINFCAASPPFGRRDPLTRSLAPSNRSSGHPFTNCVSASRPGACLFVRRQRRLAATRASKLKPNDSDSARSALSPMQRTGATSALDKNSPSPPVAFCWPCLSVSRLDPAGGLCGARASVRSFVRSFVASGHRYRGAEESRESRGQQNRLDCSAWPPFERGDGRLAPPAHRSFHPRAPAS